MKSKILLLVFCIAALAPLALAAEKTPDAAQLLEMITTSWQSVQSYEAILTEQQALSEGDSDTVRVAWRRSGEAVFEWLGGSRTGQKVVVDGNKVRGHRGGLLSFFTFTLDASDPRIETECGHTINDAGIGGLVEYLRHLLETGLNEKPSPLKISSDRWNDRRAWVVETSPPSPAEPSAALLTDSAPEPPRRVRLIVDAEWQIPVARIIIDERGETVESEEYSDLVLNAPLTDDVFAL